MRKAGGQTESALRESILTKRSEPALMSPLALPLAGSSLGGGVCVCVEVFKAHPGGEGR